MKIFNATKLTATIVLSVAIMFSACDNAKQQGAETQQQEQARQDSINKALEQMRQDSINKAIERTDLNQQYKGARHYCYALKVNGFAKYDDA